MADLSKGSSDSTFWQQNWLLWQDLSRQSIGHVFTTLLAGFLLYLVHVRYNTPLRHVPGPFVASLTRFWKIRTIFTTRQEITWVELHKKYGPLVRIGPNEISVADPPAVKVIYGAGSQFTKTSMGAQQGKYDVFSDPTREGHAASKRMISNTYSAASVRELEAFVQIPTDKLIERFAEFALSRQPMNLSDWFQWYAFDIIGEVSFSKQFGFLDAGKDVDDCLKAIDSALWSGITVAEMPELDKLRKSSLFRYLPVIGNLDTKMNFIIGQAIHALIERHKNPNVGRNDVLARLLQVQKDYPDRFSPIDVQLTISLNIFAGSDTTSIALRAIIYYLMTNPRCLEKLLDELSNATTIGALSEKNTIAEAEKLPYLQACIKEAMRLHPSVGTQHQRSVPPGGVTIAGTYLPEKTTVGINAWVMHRQKSVFGEDAEMFRPERWIDGDVSNMERHFMTFGYGAHSCVGKNIALLEINKAIPQILRRYKLRLAHPEDGGWKCVTHTFVQQKNFDVFVEPIV